MAETTIRRFYREEEFTSLAPGFGINVTHLGGVLGELALSEPIAEVRALELGEALGAVVEWAGLPSAADIAAVDAAVAAFTGGPTTSEPMIVESFAVASSTSSTPVSKIDSTSPALEGGTYQLVWNSMLKMQAFGANTGIEARLRLTRSDGVFREQVDSWDLAAQHAFNGAFTFQVTTGQTLRAQLTFSRLGASGTAEMSGARVSLDKIG